MYGQLLVLVLQPCCSCSLSCAHVIGWNCILMSEINNNNNNNKECKHYPMSTCTSLPASDTQVVKGLPVLYTLCKA